MLKLQKSANCYNYAFAQFRCRFFEGETNRVDETQDGNGEIDE